MVFWCHSQKVEPKRGICHEEFVAKIWIYPNPPEFSLMIPVLRYTQIFWYRYTKFADMAGRIRYSQNSGIYNSGISSFNCIVKAGYTEVPCKSLCYPPLLVVCATSRIFQATSKCGLVARSACDARWALEPWTRHGLGPRGACSLGRPTGASAFGVTGRMRSNRSGSVHH